MKQAGDFLSVPGQESKAKVHPRWNRPIENMPFGEVQWQEMDSHWLLFNLTTFHAGDVLFENATRDFLKWAREKWKTHKFELTEQTIKSLLKNFSAYGYTVETEPELKIYFVEFV